MCPRDRPVTVAVTPRDLGCHREKPGGVDKPVKRTVENGASAGARCSPGPTDFAKAGRVVAIGPTLRIDISAERTLLSLSHFLPCSIPILPPSRSIRPLVPSVSLFVLCAARHRVVAVWCINRASVWCSPYVYARETCACTGHDVSVCRLCARACVWEGLTWREREGAMEKGREGERKREGRGKFHGVKGEVSQFLGKRSRK